MRITSPADIPDLSGKTALVTGATGGIGLETARMLAGAGAHVILAGRSAEKGAAALREIAASKIRGRIEFERFDLADLADVAAAAARIDAMHAQIDILVNNAGVMMPPERQTTADGFELQLGTNHLAHFALTGRLLPRLRAGEARVVMVSSNAARSGRMAFENLQSERNYSPWRAYGQSKLANLLFMRALQQASDADGWGLCVVASHPGLSATSLISSGMGTGLVPRLGNMFNRLVAQSPADGALPTVAAATDPDLAPLSFVGPAGVGGWRGKPKLVKLPAAAEDDVAARRLWEVSENLTGVRFGD
ncbi:oxidoreductase [Devosia naphthalenivorans]|uniref:oxidoreductase n=1 Tax=Devosia naphthalenivorans TaxID=2082392 RepID=UPI000D3B4243|nr:oxidoreductase [Devosia naphthalenivorans]